MKQNIIQSINDYGNQWLFFPFCENILELMQQFWFHHKLYKDNISTASEQHGDQKKSVFIFKLDINVGLEKQNNESFLHRWILSIPHL